MRILKVPLPEVMKYWIDNYIIPDNMEIDQYFLDGLTAELVVVFKEKE